MQSKGAIRLFAILFSIACIYQLSFTWITSSIEKDAKEYAQGNPEKERRYLDSMASEPVYNLLVKKYTYRECKEREINLGLDLQGGMNVTLEVSVIDLIKNMADNSQDPTFLKAIEKAKEYQKNSQEDFVTLFGKAFKDIDPNARLSSPTIFGNREMKGKINPFETSNEEVLEIVRKEATDAIDRTYIILRSRIDKFGVSQPNIVQLGNTGRILVELPGVKEKERVRKLLQGTAQLEFWETFENAEIYPYLSQANDIIAKIEKGAPLNDSTSSSTIADSAVVSNNTTATDSTKKEDPLSLLDEINKDSTGAAAKDTAGAQSFEKFAKDNPLFAVLRPAIYEQNGQYYPNQGPAVGYVALKDTGKINQLLALSQVKNVFPNNLKFAWTVKPFDEEGKFVQLIALKVSKRDGSPALSGDVVVDARQEFGQFGGSPEVNMTMNAEGAKIWKLLTREASSQNPKRSIAIVLDNFVYSFPTVNGEIGGGNSSISGNFSINEAKDLANILKSGKLPAPARIVEEAVVGPTLGKEAIQAGLLSLLFALIVVLVYMIVWYSGAGVVSAVAIFANLFFIMGVLSSLQAVLTLPGIAGIVLIIGMSVDANVLIFERVREELKNGKGLRLAIDDGYSAAYSSIIDANVTSLLTGIVLYVFGSGPIRGFATVTVIGILTSLFAAIFITRLIFVYQLDKNKTIKFLTSFSANKFQNFTFDFVGKRKIAYIFSGILIAISIFSFIGKGFNLGVDFKGGRTYVVRFEKTVSTAAVRDVLFKSIGEAPEVKTFGDDNQVKITTKFKIEEESETVDQEVENLISTTLSSSQIGGNSEILSSQKVGPTIADDIKTSAFWAILFSLVIMFAYIAVRFRRIQFGFAAIIALAHDVIIVLGAFSLLWGILPFSLEIDQAFIAAILTVIGYSINDTVVVFDRIRENLGKTTKSHEVVTIVNESLNTTLGRTFNTSFTTLIVLLSAFLFGGEIIRGFSFALMLGIIVGTYSSLFIASPLVVDLNKKDKELH